jgi:hypothetical protein
VGNADFNAITLETGPLLGKLANPMQCALNR